MNKKSKAANVKPFMVKNHLWIFVNAQIENPAFDSQVCVLCVMCYVCGLRGVRGCMDHGCCPPLSPSICVRI
jgi:DNA gyrase B